MKKSLLVITCVSAALCVSAQDLYLATEKGKDGYINLKGEWVIPPRFEKADAFQDGLARARENGKWGYINEEGKWAAMPIFETAKRFVNGYAQVKEKATDSGTY